MHEPKPWEYNPLPVKGDRFVPNFPRYRVTVEGRVYRALDGKTISHQSRNGYLRVRLLGPCDRQHWVPIHRIVLEAFVGPRPTPRHHGAHLSGDRSDNSLGNLVWKLPKDNEADKKMHGTAPKGGKRVATSKRLVSRIHARVQAGESLTKIAARYNLHRSSVSRIVRGLRRRM